MSEIPAELLERCRSVTAKLLSASANRAKSWSCEHCENWNNLKDRKVCLTCYWAFPEHYSHVATREIRQIDLVWQGDEVAVYERLKAAAHDLGKEVPEFVKEVLAREAKLPD